MTLKVKINQAKTVILKANKTWPAKQIAVAWTGGKDSTVLLHLIKQTLNQPIPFKVIFNDSTIEFPEVYQFIDKLKKDWHLNLTTIKHPKKDLQAYRQTKNKKQQMEIMRLSKITAINQAVKQLKLKAIFSGIRWDEHPARSKETFFSKRKNHTRIHPLLGFTVKDIWQYIKNYNLPYVSLYDQGYKSLGEAPFTKPSPPNAPERSGREATKEKVMDRLRQLGYW